MKTNVLKTTTLLLLAMLWASTALMAQNMNRYITLTVVDGADIKFKLAADADGTPVQIVSGTNTYDITVGANWTGEQVYTAGATTMTVYGDIKKINCFGNYENITGLDPTKNTGLIDLNCAGNSISSLDVSQNTTLTMLACYSNHLTSLDVTQNTSLKELTCFFNQFTSLDVSQNIALEVLFCYSNQLTSLDVSHNTALRRLFCSRNQLTSLDVSQNTALTWLICSENQLSSLDVSANTALQDLYCEINQITGLDLSQNTALKKLICHLNPFSTQTIDNIYCALPDRSGLGEGVIYTLNNASDPNYADGLASNAQNARNKNWQVWYYDNYDGTLHDVDIPTTGTYVCGSNISVTGVSVSPTSVSLKQGETAQLTATVSPGNATNQNVTWSSSDNNVATVDANGVVTGVSVGNVTITVITEDGGFTAVCQVKIAEGIEELSLSNIAKVYPNPVYETLYIEPQTTKEFTVELYNTHGQMVLQSQNNTTISVADLPKGVYMLKLMIDQQVYSTKVVK